MNDYNLTLKFSSKALTNFNEFNYKQNTHIRWDEYLISVQSKFTSGESVN